MCGAVKRKVAKRLGAVELELLWVDSKSVLNKGENRRYASGSVGCKLRSVEVADGFISAEKAEEGGNAFGVHGGDGLHILQN